MAIVMLAQAVTIAAIIVVSVVLLRAVLKHGLEDFATSRPGQLCVYSYGG